MYSISHSGQPIEAMERIGVEELANVVRVGLWVAAQVALADIVTVSIEICTGLSSDHSNVPADDPVPGESNIFPH